MKKVAYYKGVTRAEVLVDKTPIWIPSLQAQHVVDSSTITYKNEYEFADLVPGMNIVDKGSLYLLIYNKNSTGFALLSGDYEYRECSVNHILELLNG